MREEEKLKQFMKENKDLILAAEKELNERIDKLKPMPVETVKKRIDEINEYLAKFLWTELAFTKIDEESIILMGCDDLICPDPKIEITFCYPQMMAGPFSWIIEENQKPFLSLSSKEELREKTGLYAYHGRYVFKMQDEEIRNPYGIFIAATGIHCQILKGSGR